MSNVSNINSKLIQLAKLLRTLPSDELEKVLINRAVLDRIYLMKHSERTDFELLECLTFRELILLESYYQEL